MKMTIEQKHRQCMRLKAVSKEEWAKALDDLTEALSDSKLLGGRAVIGPHKNKILVGARTLFGVHSNFNLCTSNVLYYYQADLIIALYDCKWYWPEDVSLSEMLIRMACSRIPKAVKKYRRQKAKEEELGINTTPVNFDADWVGKEDDAVINENETPDDEPELSPLSDSDESAAEDKAADDKMMDIRHKRWELVCDAAESDPQLKAYVQVVGESKQLKDVREKGGYKPGDTDKLIKRLRRKVIKLVESNKENKSNTEYGS